MAKIGIGIDYSNICKDYNTAYLDRDNKDPQTAKCMKAVVAWMQKLLEETTEHFGYRIFHLSTDSAVRIEDVAANRFLFYSLEKEITLQSFVLQKSFKAYDNTAAWEAQSPEGALIQNDEDGEGVYLYCEKDSPEHTWFLEKLKAFSLDEVSLQPK